MSTTDAVLLVDSTVGSHLSDFSLMYAGIHGYVSLVVCLLGVISNVFIVIVLTRKVMVNPTSRILTALAVSDLLTMSSYIPFAYHFYVLHWPDTHQRSGVGWMRFFLVHVHLSVTAHTTSIWLGVLLSVYRYSYVKNPSSGSLIGAIGCSSNAVSYAIGAVYTLSIVAMIPNYMSLQIIRFDTYRNDSAAQSNRTIMNYDIRVGKGDVIVAKPTDDGETNANPAAAYYDVLSIDATDDARGALITRINFWIHALLVKLLPCALMSVFGLLIVCAVRSTHRKGSMLRKNSTRTDTVTLRRRESNRTTSMLVAVIVLFLVTELPQGILALLSGIVDGFFETYYTPLGDLMDIVALINNGINFTLYCSMSNRFRRTFFGLFCSCLSAENDVDLGREMIALRTIMLTVNVHNADQRRIVNSN